jgi:hypothetical protein
MPDIGMQAVDAVGGRALIEFSCELFRNFYRFPM